MTEDRVISERDEKDQLLRALQVGKLGSWEVDLEHAQLKWSDVVFSIFEIDRGDFAETEEAFFDFIHPEDRASFLEARDEWLAAGGSFFFEHRIITPRGKIKWVVERAEILADEVGEPKFTTGTVHDITDLKQAELARDKAERELERQERLVKLASKIGKIGGWCWAPDTDLIEWSSETARIHDEPEEFSPTVEQGLSYYVPEHRDRIRALFEACATEGRPYEDIFQIETAKGRRVWVHSMGEAVRDENGKIVAVEGAFQDVTSLIEQQEKAREFSDRLRNTIEAMNDAFFLLDEQWKFAFVNTNAESLLQRSRESLMGKVIWAEFPKAVGSTFEENYNRAVAEKCIIRFDEYFEPLETWFEVTADPTPDGLAVYFRDVTQTRNKEAQLRLLEASVSRINDTLLIAEINLSDGAEAAPKIVYVNDAFERCTGYARKEVIGQPLRVLDGAKTQRTALDRIQNALKERHPVRAELVNYRKSGEEFWLELDMMPLANETGEATHWIAVGREITERKQAELTLRASEERFRLVTMAVGSAVWDWDVANDQHWWSEGLREIFGHDLNASGSLEMNWARFVHPDDLAQVRAQIEKVMSGQQSSLCMEYRFQRADGSWAIVEDNAFAIRDEAGKVYRVLGSLSDVSEQKLFEDRLRQSHKMETVGQLSGGIAHDFNNLLTIIMGNAEVLEEELSEFPELQAFAKMSLEAAESGAELTQRLLAFSRKQTLEPMTLDAAQLIQGMDGLLRRALPENIDIEIVRLGGLWKIEVDAPQLETALLNLALNARDAMPDGGCLTIEIANSMLDDAYVATEPGVKPGQYVSIVVTDTGTGMPPELLERVFEPFFTTKDVGKGSGLGLSMVFGFVKQSGGHIRIYSEPGEGTSIKMYFPRKRTGKEAVEILRSRQNVVGGGETILVVEDNDNVRKYVTAQLQALGYTVFEASSGADGIEVIKNNSGIDLLFTDVIMPGSIGGRELEEIARQLQPDIKVLFTSGYTENSIVHNGRLDLGVKLLNKPYRRETLAAKVREVLDESEAEDQNEGED